VSNNGPNERVQTPKLKLKKTQTATMKRRVLKPKNIEKSTAGFASQCLARTVRRHKSPSTFSTSIRD
jgi:hypothetical protein